MKHRSKTLLLASFLVACQTQSIQPELIVADRFTWSQTPTIKAVGLNPGQVYTLKTERVSNWNENAAERSVLTYIADEKGQINTSTQGPEEDGVMSAYRPIQSMKYLSDTPLNDLAPHTLRLTLSDEAGTVSLISEVGLGPDRSKLVEEPLGPSFQGAYVLKPIGATGPLPAVVILGGSEGGDSGSRYSAPLIAAEGYTVLGLPYYSPAWGREAQFPDLPSAFANIEVDYLERAVLALRQRDDVDPDRISVYGGSKGAEFVLLAGSLIPDESSGGGFCGIVANVPSDVVWEGWGARETVSSFSWRGEPLPFIPYTDISRALDRSDAYTMTEAHENGRRDHPERLEAARIRVEEIDEPVLVVGGDKDTTWASGPMARTIKATRDAAGLETESYTYADAGHGVSGTPLARTSAANLEARLENFPATMAFLSRVSQRNCRG